MKKARHIIAMVLALVLTLNLIPLSTFGVESEAADWIGVGEAAVSNGNTISNGRMYYKDPVNLPQNGLKIKFTINEVPAYQTDTGEDGWIGLFISANGANPDNYGNFNSNDGFQFLIRGLTASTDPAVNKIKAEMSVSAGGNVFHKGSADSARSAVGEHELVFYSKGKNEDGLDIWAGAFDGIAFMDDAEGFRFDAARISIGVHHPVENSTGSITVSSVESYDPAQGNWLGVGGSTVINGNTVSNGRMYYKDPVNLPQSGLKIKFTLNDVPAYQTDTGEDGWIGLYISANGANPDNYGNFNSNDGFQFLIRGLTASTDPNVNKVKTEMSVSAGGNIFHKGSADSARSAVGEHELVFYSKGRNEDGLDIWAGAFDGAAFMDDLEGFAFDAARLSIGVYNPVAGSTGSITIDAVEGYQPEPQEQPEGNWIGTGGSVVIDGSTLENGTMYYKDRINLPRDGIRIKFAVNKIPAYYDDTGEDGWIGLYISANNANPDNCGNFNSNDGFQFLIRGLTVSTDPNVNKVKAEMSVSATELFLKGDVYSKNSAVGEHELILYRKGDAGNGLDIWAAKFDGKRFAEDIEGFDFTNAMLSVGVNAPVNGSVGNITIQSVESYSPGSEGDSEPVPEDTWLYLNDEPVENVTVVNDKMYYSNKINLPVDGICIDFTVNEVPAYQTDTGEDGWIGLFITHNASTAAGYGTFCGNDGFQFLFRGMSASAKAQVKAQVEMSAVSNGMVFHKGVVTSGNSAAGRHQLILFKLADSAGLDVWCAMFDGKLFDLDMEGFAFTEAVLSVGIYNPVSGRNGSITIDKVSSYQYNGEDLGIFLPQSVAFEKPVDLDYGMAEVVLNISQVAGYHSTDAKALAGNPGGKDTWIAVTFGQSMSDAYAWGSPGDKTVAFMIRAHSPGYYYGQTWCNGEAPPEIKGYQYVGDNRLVIRLEATNSYVRLYFNGYIVLETDKLTRADFPGGLCYVSVNDYYGPGITRAWKYSVKKPALYNLTDASKYGEWTTAAKLNGLLDNIITVEETSRGVELQYNNVRKFSLASQAVYTVPVDITEGFSVKFRIDEPMAYHGLSGSPDVAYIFSLNDKPGGFDLEDRTGAKGLYMFVRPEADNFLVGSVGMQFGAVNEFNMSLQHFSNNSISTHTRLRPISYVQELRVEPDEYGTFTMFLNGIEVTDPTSLGILGMTDPSMFADGKAYLSITAHNDTGEAHTGKVTVVEINGQRFTENPDEEWEEIQEDEVLDPRWFNNLNSGFIAKTWDIWIGSNIITLNDRYTVESFRASVYLAVGCNLEYVDKGGKVITGTSVSMEQVHSIRFTRYGEVTDIYTVYSNDIL